MVMLCHDFRCFRLTNYLKRKRQPSWELGTSSFVSMQEAKSQLRTAMKLVLAGLTPAAKAQQSQLVADKVGCQLLGSLALLASLDLHLAFD